MSYIYIINISFFLSPCLPLAVVSVAVVSVEGTKRRIDEDTKRRRDEKTTKSRCVSTVVCGFFFVLLRRLVLRGLGLFRQSFVGIVFSSATFCSTKSRCVSTVVFWKLFFSSRVFLCSSK